MVVALDVVALVSWGISSAVDNGSAVVFGSANHSSFVAASRAYISSLMEKSMDELHVEILAIPLLAHDLELRQILSLILRIDGRITASQLVFNEC
jgi:hypothetical protein